MTVLVLSASDMLTPRSAARRAGVSRPTLQRWIDLGLLDASVVAGRYYIAAAAVDAFLVEHAALLPRHAGRAQ